MNDAQLAARSPPPARVLAARATHVPALDGVRGLAALMVLAFHFLAFSTSPEPLERAVVWLFGLGCSGVDLFFVLSGFLITTILCRSRDEPFFFRNFYVRRTLRIFPLYYGILIAVFLLAIRLGSPSGAWVADLRRAEPWLWLYGINFFSGTHPVHTYLDHFWSLSVEEHFYLVWPVMVWWLSSRPKTLLVVSLVIAALSRTSRIVADVGGVNELALYSFTFFRLDALCIGAALAIHGQTLAGRQWQRRAAPTVAWACAAVFAVTVLAELGKFPSPRAIEHFRSLALIGSFSALVVAAAQDDVPKAWLPKLLSSKTLTFLGKYSYGIYVFHAILARFFWIKQPDVWLGRQLGSHLLAVFLQAAFGTALSVALAVASYELYETRFLALKDRWAPLRRASVA